MSVTNTNKQTIVCMKKDKHIVKYVTIRLLASVLMTVSNRSQ